MSNKLLTPEEIAANKNAAPQPNAINNTPIAQSTTSVPTPNNVKPSIVENKIEEKEKKNEKEQNNVSTPTPTISTIMGKTKFFILTGVQSSYSVFGIRVEKDVPLEITDKNKKAVEYMVKKDIGKVIEK